VRDTCANGEKTRDADQEEALDREIKILSYVMTPHSEYGPYREMLIVLGCLECDLIYATKITWQ
jgi:hypothetical protein